MLAILLICIQLYWYSSHQHITYHIVQNFNGRNLDLFVNFLMIRQIFLLICCIFGILIILALLLNRIYVLTCPIQKKFLVL